MSHEPRMPVPRSPAEAACALPQELRCTCGSLMARLLAGDIELKCRRCKRVLLIESDVRATGKLTSNGSILCECAHPSKESQRAL